MHSCPNCGSACYCGGDIDDIEVGDGAEDRCTHCDEFDEDSEDDREHLVLDCGTPGCVMPGAHFPSECHTAEDLEREIGGIVSDSSALPPTSAPSV